MNRSRKCLIFGGLALAVLGMLYGLHYAVFIEHQTLDQMGGSLAMAFVHAANHQMPEVHNEIGTYSATKYNYVRQVDVHSHWIGLSMLMIVLGATFDRVGFTERVRLRLAISLLAGSVIFSLGVVLQMINHGGMIPSTLAVTGSALVTIALAGVAWGFARQTE